MGYHIDEQATEIGALAERLRATDLIPSQLPLLDGLSENMNALKRAGIANLADLRKRLKSKKALAALAEETGVDSGYLTLLRRAVEGFFPKPRPLKEFDWLPSDVIVALEKAGVTNTLLVYEAVSSGVKSGAARTGVSEPVITELAALSDLCRVQWVSPTFARTLLAVGYSGAAQLAEAESQALYDAILQANENGRYYKGKVGLRDISRLITAAGYVS